MFERILAKHSPRSTFTLKELLMVVAVLGALFALAVPAIESARETSRRNECVNKLKQIGLALGKFESQHSCFPPISSNLDSTPDIPGDAPAALTGTPPGTAEISAAGYSWIVFLLPQFQETTLYTAIGTNSQRFALP